jgi:hypothetical protein
MRAVSQTVATTEATGEGVRGSPNRQVMKVMKEMKVMKMMKVRTKKSREPP